MLQVAFFKGRHPGLKGLFGQAIKSWENGLYSHVELVFSDGVCGSAMYWDGGVRLKSVVEFTEGDWDFVTLPDYLEAPARQWFIDHAGKAYDFFGDVKIVLPFIKGSNDTWFCSRSIAAALGIEDSGRYEPNVLASAVKIFNRKAP